jgi:hypothetical protein
MFKKFIILSLLLILNNCASPTTALLGPSITGVRTGSIYQAGFSYSSGQVLQKAKKHLEKIEKTKKIVSQQIDQLNDKIIKDKLNRVVSSNQADIFFKAVKDNLKKYN